MGVLGCDLSSLLCVHDLDAVGLTVLYTARELPLGLSIGAQVTLFREHGEVRELPFVRRVFPWPYLVELDSVLIGRKLVFHLACELA